MDDDKPETDDSARGSTHRRHEGPHSDAARPAGVDVSIQSHYDARGVDCQDRRRDLSGIHQIVAAAADVHGAPQPSKKSALRLPGDPIREATLHLQTFLTLHPRVYGCEKIARISWHRTRCCRESGAGDLRHEAALIRHIDASSLFG